MGPALLEAEGISKIIVGIRVGGLLWVDWFV